MVGRWRFLAVLVAGAVTALTTGVAPAGAAPSLPSGGPQAQAGRAAPLPATPPQPAHLAAMGASTTPAQAASDAAVEAAARQAQASGKPVTVTALTTGTTTVTAMPDHQLTETEHLLPVQVRNGTGWVPVNTALARNAAGAYSPRAVPSDAVTFSGGGSGPMATISAAGTSLALTWPGSLPAPVVAGDTATYSSVLPGIDVVLTATSGQSGGFSGLLVVHDAAAARNPALTRLRLGVTAHGVRLTAVSGGALTAAGEPGYYAAPAPLMWDSSRPVSPAGQAAATRQAQAVGATVAAPGEFGSSPAGAHAATVTTAATDTWLTLVPDQAMLSSPSTTFPVTITTAGFQWHTNDGDRMHFDQTQKGCPGAAHYDDPSYWALGVGYDGWGGCAGINGPAHADYEVAVPPQIDGAHLSSATMKTQEAFTADCKASANVTLSWIGTINKNTAWANDPADLGDQQTVNVPPNNVTVGGTEVNCGNNFDTSPSTFIGVDFNVMPAMTLAAAGHWSAFTFRLWENGDTNRDDWKKFGQNPFLQIVWNDTPGVPADEAATATSQGGGNAGCDTTGTGPRAIGAESGPGPYLGAHFLDADGDPVTGTIRYWKYPASSPAYNMLSTPALNNQPDAEPIPQSFYSSLTNGQVIAWDVRASDGTFVSAWSATCYFTAWPTAPGSPALSAPVPGSDCPGAVITAGCQVTFTITAASNDPAATEFVWRLDDNPADTGPPASEILPASGSPPSAKLTITAPSPGPHNLWVHASTPGVANSGDTNGAPGGETTFTAAGDPGATCASFAAALASTCTGSSAPDTMISTAAARSCAGTTGDGSGDSLDAADLTNAGWVAGHDVTIDGASFTLPGFGSCQSDNVLAAKQTIGMPAGSRGSAVVFLATSTNAVSGTVGLTGAQGSSQLTSDVTVPGVPAGIAATGSGCTHAQQSDQNMAGCTPATGTVTYLPGCGQNQASYYLTVPDWISGPGDIAALILPHQDKTTGQNSANAKIYAFAVPVDPACQIQSVTLPDVGATVNVQLDSGSSPASYNPPALHIFGVAVRDTTTATPQANGTNATTPSGQSWTGAWAQPAEGGYGGPAGSWGGQTLRIEATASAGGSAVRIRLSDPGFISLDKAAPLQIAHATIAVASAAGSPAPAATPQNLMFGGSQSVVIPKGGDSYSDPLPFAVSAGQNLLVSLYLANGSGSLPYLPGHTWADSSYQWISASGDATTDTSGASFPSSSWGINTYILDGIDVTTAQTPTVAVLGENLTDVNYNVFASDAISFPVSRVTSGLAAAEAGSFGVVAAGVNSNQASADAATASGSGGVSAIARLDRDVLAEPGIGTVILDEGLQDVLHGATETDLSDAYSAIANELNGFGVSVIIATITPCSGYSSAAAGGSCTAAADTTRNAVNEQFIETYDNPFFTPPACFADFDAAVSNGAAPESLLTADDAGDHINLTRAGYTALIPAVTAQGCTLVANINPIS